MTISATTLHMAHAKQRNKHGFYTLDAVKAGHLDQYAYLRNGRKVVVEIAWSATCDRFTVTFTDTRAGVVVEHRIRAFDALDDARRTFKAIVRSHP